MRIYQVCINYAVKTVQNIADDNFYNFYMLENHIFSNIFSVTGIIIKDLNLQNIQ